jgi:hypothetical protein
MLSVIYYQCINLKSNTDENLSELEIRIHTNAKFLKYGIKCRTFQIIILYYNTD